MLGNGDAFVLRSGEAFVMLSGEASVLRPSWFEVFLAAPLSWLRGAGVVVGL